MAKDFKITYLVLDTDAHALKIMIDKAYHFPYHELSSIIKDVVQLLQADWVVNACKT